ncbi:MAG: hypothetical protein M1420_04240 [Actinobacteria bacterium]|jgi:hypothetical protein|nr:hypothetical protein [Actinomycetota bacterium]
MVDAGSAIGNPAAWPVGEASVSHLLGGWLSARASRARAWRPVTEQLPVVMDGCGVWMLKMVVEVSE